MARRVDEVERIGFAVLRSIIKGDGARLDGNAALALKLHVVEDLILHFARADRVASFQQTVGERRLAVVNVRDNAKVSYVFSVHVTSSYF